MFKITKRTKPKLRSFMLAPPARIRTITKRAAFGGEFDGTAKIAKQPSHRFCGGLVALAPPARIELTTNP